MNDPAPPPHGIGKIPPIESASRWMSDGQKNFLFFSAVALAFCLWYRPFATVKTINALLLSFYTLFLCYKMVLAGAALLLADRRDLEVKDLCDDDLPVYTILIPLYREQRVYKKLIESIRALDYPLEKLDVKLLLESDDQATLRVAGETELPPCFEKIVIPDSFPKTKPKALNIGLERARGEFLVIYDAEDRPEPAQLKKAVAAYRANPLPLACVQARLDFYNPDENVLARWFTNEYAVWFGIYLPGINCFGGPTPLGGTSNHFRTDVLKRMGGWDAYNVAEDCDLGIRMYRRHYTVGMIDSVTHEEANCRSVWAWIRQRSRWIKGYLQTYLVYMRTPPKLLRSLGAVGFINFQMLVGGSVLALLLAPLYWGLTAYWLWKRPEIVSRFFPGPILWLGLGLLVVGNFFLIFTSALKSYHAGRYTHVKYALAEPAYWLLQSLGAYKGVMQFCTQPFFWEKTEHGKIKTSAPRRKAIDETHGRTR